MRTRLFFLVFVMKDFGHLEEIAQKAASRHACDVVQLSYRREQPGWVLRVLIERRGADPRHGSGVDHALCAAVSRDLSHAIDVEDAIIDSFVLEVSSPGIERPLTRLADYDRFKGLKIRLETASPIAGRKRYSGTIRGAEGDRVSLALEDGETAVIPFDEIAKAHLACEGGEVVSRSGEK